MKDSRLGINNIFLILALSIFAWGPLLTPVYFLKAHDAAHSVFFLTEFHQGIQDGYLYPRWGPDHGLGYGYPTFIFYAPLAYYVAEVFHLLGAGPTAAVKITYALAFILSGLTMYAFVKRLWGAGAGLVSAVVYTYVPYRLVDIYVRCAFTEFCAFVFFPLILLLFLELVETGQLRYLALAGLAYAGLILTHIVTAFLFTPPLIAYVLWLVLRKAGLSLRQWLRLSGFSLAAAVLALGLSAVFLLPMLAERNHIAQEQWTRATYSYDQHFIYPFQLLSAFWDYGYAVEGPKDTMSLQLGLVAVTLTLMVAVLALRRRKSGRGTVLYHGATVPFFLGLTLVIILAMLPLSFPLWRLLSVAALVQFPWRLLALTAFTLSVLAGAVVPRLSSEAHRNPGAEKEKERASVTNPGLYVLLLVVILASFGYTLPEYTELSPRLETPAAPLDFELAHPDMVSMVAYTREQPRSTPLVAQYLAGEPLVKAHALTEEATVDMVRHGGGSEEIIVRSSQEATIQFYTYYFPGWRGYVDGQEVPIRPEEPYGLITLDVPAGEHQVKIRFGDTPIRVVGKVISLLSFGLSLFLLKDDFRRVLTRGKRRGLRVSKKERKVPRPNLSVILGEAKNLSELPAVPLSIALLVIAALVALGVTRPWQHQKVAAIIPAATDTPTPTTNPTPTPTTTSTATPTSTPTATSTATPTPTPVIYVVQSGDTLLAIALEYSTTVDALLQANDLDERQMIYPGQELVVVPPAPTADIPPTPTPEPTRFLTHIVESGENLTSIATDYGTTVEAIVAANHIEDPRSLRTGQELIIPLAGSVGGPTPVPGAPTAPPRGTEVVVHVVQPGDSLLGIALQYDTSVEVIMAANNIADAQWIIAGQELLIPLGTPTPVPTPTPRPTPTPTPGPPYVAPDLLDPAEGESFRGEEADIVLNWASVGILAEDEWYILRLRLMTAPVYQHPSIWTKVTSWRVPASLHPSALRLGSGQALPAAGPSAEAKSHLFRWDVTVIRHTGTRPDGKPDGIAISPMSATRSFFWY